jgi:hypothetical protein
VGVCGANDERDPARRCSQFIECKEVAGNKVRFKKQVQRRDMHGVRGELGGENKLGPFDASE